MVGVLLLLRRRWRLALAGLLLTIAFCGNVLASAQPYYQATGQMLFLLPPTNPDPTRPPVNPYLNLQDGMGTTANLISGMVTTKDVEDQLARRGLTAEYTVTYLSQTGPILQVDASHPDPQVADRTRDAVMDLVDAELATLQQEADTPKNQLMTATRPTVSKHPVALYGGVYTAAGVTAITGLLLVMLLCFAVDRRLLRQRSRRDARADLVEATTEGDKASQIRRGPGLPAVDEDEDDEPVVASLQHSNDPTGGAADERIHEQATENDLDEPDAGSGELRVPLDRHESGTAEKAGASTDEVPGPAVRVTSQSRRHRDRMARRRQQADAAAVEAPEGSDDARPRSLAG
ncbi:hypothetical protein [Nocardioides dilutus]